MWNDTATSVHEATGERSGMVDAILCPVGPGVAPRHNTAKYWPYTSQWNLLDYPAVSFPVCKVDREVDGGKERSEFLGGLDRENWELCETFLLRFARQECLFDTRGRREICRTSGLTATRGPKV